MSIHQLKLRPPAAPAGLSEVRFSQGMALVQMADKYPLVEDGICEGIQNALDAHATVIKIIYNRGKRRVTIYDDGDGASIAKFDAALKQICTTQKTEDKLGRFGIGVISPLGKCERFTFTSCPRQGKNGYIQWTFNSEEIKAQSDAVFVPREPIEGAEFSRTPGKARAGQTLFPWRTRVQWFGVTSDRHISRFSVESIEQRVHENFNHVLMELGTAIEITVLDGKVEVEKREIRGRKFRGKKLPPYCYRNGVTGQVTNFEFGVAPMVDKQRRGKVKLGEGGNPFRIGMATFLRSDIGRIINTEALEALNSGYFEGEIVDSAVKLHVSRKSFVQDDALYGLGSAIEAWYAEAGKGHMEAFTQTSRLERYQRIGERSAAFVDAMLKDPRFESIRDFLKTMKVGTVGRGHADPDTRRLGEQDEKSKVAYGAAPGHTRQGEGDGGPSGSAPEHDLPGHTPTVVRGPRGQHRVEVRGDSQGLQFAYDHEGSISPKLWELSLRDGTLIINTCHPLWAGLEGKSSGESRLGKFQDMIVMSALTYAVTPADWRPMAARVSDDFMEQAAYWILNGDQITGRFGARGKKKQ